MVDQNILYMTVGLPRSGKSTWSRKYNKSPIVNPDSIRLVINKNGQRYVEENEPEVWRIAKIMVAALFKAGHKKVILDATNIKKKNRDFFKSNEYSRVFVQFNATKEECIHRAIYIGDLEIIPIIERMAEEFEPISSDEGGTCRLPL